MNKLFNSKKVIFENNVYTEVEDDDVEVDDEWEKSEDDDSWDPDFEEFDLPKSGAKKTPGKKSSDEDDLKIDEDFKEFGLFDDMDSGGGFDDDDDY